METAPCGIACRNFWDSKFRGGEDQLQLALPGLGLPRHASQTPIT